MVVKSEDRNCSMKVPSTLSACSVLTSEHVLQRKMTHRDVCHSKDKIFAKYLFIQSLIETSFDVTLQYLCHRYFSPVVLQ